MQDRAHSLLSHFKKDIRYPIWHSKMPYFSLMKSSIVNACNLLDGCLVAKYDINHRTKPSKETWLPISIQHEYYIGKVYSLTVSHNQLYIADSIVTHNCQYPENEHYYCGFELVVPKVRRSLRMLESAYGFEREIAENNNANSRFKNLTVDQFVAHLNKTLDAYATEHSKLRVYNRAQWCAREAAIALGERNWNRATKCLKELSAHLGDRDEWVAYASPYSEDFDNGSSLI